VPAIIYDFRAIGGTLRKQRIDDWWQPAQREPEPEPVKRMSNDAWYDPFGWVFWPERY
jgi:hypothetical protein